MLAAALLTALTGAPFCYAAQQEEITLNVVIWYDFSIPEDFDMIQERADAMTEETLGLHVNLVPVLGSTLRREVDMIEKEGGCVDVVVNENDSFSMRPLDDLLEEYGQDIMRLAGEKELDWTRKNGVLYGLPSRADCVASAGIAFRSDILEKYEIDVSQLTTLEQVDELYDKISALEPDLTMVSPLYTGRGFATRYKQYSAVPDTVFDFTGDDPTAVNVYETQEYEDFVTLIRSWYEKGYLPDELPLINVKGQDLMRTGTLFSYFCACKPGIEWEENVSSRYEVTVVSMKEPEITNDSVQISPWGIAEESTHPEESMRFLNMLYSDSDLVNLLINGVEGVHYEVMEDGMIDFPDGVTAENSGYYPNMGWSFPNQMLSYVWEGNEVNLWEETQKFVESAEVSPVLGFAFDDTGVKRMNRTLNEIAEKYSSGLESGLLDPEVYLKKMRAEMREAGSDQVREELQRQYEAWKENKQ